MRASRRGQAVEYAIRDIMVKAEEVRRTGKKILYLNIGDPVKYGFETPLHIRDALKKAVDAGSNYYSASEGVKGLREAVAEKENSVNGAHVDPRNVMITQGISEAISFLMGAIVNPGDEVLLPGPSYSPYMTYVKFFDGKAVTYRTIEDRGWAPDLSDLESKVTARTRLIVIINPSNPTGAVYSRNELSRILEIAASHHIPVAADEIYDRIVYDGGFTSVASIAKEVPLFGLNGFSKTYMMTGWRLGYLYLQDPGDEMRDVWDAVQRISRVRLCASTPIQFAGIEALRGPQGHITEMVSKLKRRRDLFWKRANEIPGLFATKPAGAFYLFPRINAIGHRWKSDYEFVTELLKETGVLVVHGSGFDPIYGKDHFRAVFLPDETILTEAFDAIEDFMKRR
ncbi:MAG: aminotransferase class I/II-fold pyridoxal phosphate-dependent enzyme [Candidatus Bathyarchaeia archaeon]|jgi:aspartate/methionine/tyrosine aminotransferase